MYFKTPGPLTQYNLILVFIFGSVIVVNGLYVTTTTEVSDIFKVDIVSAFFYAMKCQCVQVFLIKWLMNLCQYSVWHLYDIWHLSIFSASMLTITDLK